MKKITVEAPCTIANVGSGFDVLGLAIEKPCDRLTLTEILDSPIRFSEIEGADLSFDPKKNVVGKAILAMQSALEKPVGVEIKLEKLITPGSGLGSSAASAAAAVFAYNQLLGNPFSNAQLIDFALEGEALASGSKHADNVAPALLGGVCLIQGDESPVVTDLCFPEDLYIGVVFPQVEVKTAEARGILKSEILFKQAIKQWGNVAGLVAGFLKKDKALIAHSLEDVIVTPQRSKLIPHFKQIQNIALQKKALGMSISGSGPTMFAMFDSLTQAQQFAEASAQFYQTKEIETEAFTSQINPKGVTLI